MTPFPLSKTEVHAFVADAFGEDLGVQGDITAQAVISPTHQLSADITAREALVVCGTPLAIAFFKALSSDIEIEIFHHDGDHVEANTPVLHFKGPARAILAAERPALNLLQHLSGIASRTRQYVSEIKGSAAQLLDTRKTIPGYRKLAKYATSCGGAQNHRMGLYDAVLIKDNHIAVQGNIQNVIQAAQAAGHKDIEVECDTLEQVKDALAAGATRLLLDNMSPKQLTEAVAFVDKRIPLEASGGVTLSTIREIAETGVDFISVGSDLTLSAPAKDLGLDFK